MGRLGQLAIDNGIGQREIPLLIPHQGKKKRERNISAKSAQLRRPPNNYFFMRTLLALYRASLSGAMMQMMCFWGVYPWDHIMGVVDDWLT